MKPIPSVDVTVDVKHVGETAGDDTNEFFIDGYTLVDAAATWRHGPLRLTLSARNLFDAAYYFDGNSESADPGRPRQIRFIRMVSASSPCLPSITAQLDREPNRHHRARPRSCASARRMRKKSGAGVDPSPVL